MESVRETIKQYVRFPNWLFLQSYNINELKINNPEREIRLNNTFCINCKESISEYSDWCPLCRTTKRKQLMGV
jgi:hypothetical protein